MCYLFAFYSSVLAEIMVACDLKKEDRVLRPRRDTDNLLTNPRYTTMVTGLLTRFADVKEFLGYEEEFWNFVELHLKEEPVPAETAEHSAGVFVITDSEDKIDNFYTIVPKIIDFDTAMITVAALEKAYAYYKSLGIDIKEFGKVDTDGVKKAYESSMEEQAYRLIK